MLARKYQKLERRGSMGGAERWEKELTFDVIHVEA
jgi:hypothetical protein